MLKHMNAPISILEVPDNFNRNAIPVREMATPEETGKMLIDYMCERIGIDDLGEMDVLDFGCGVRFAQSIINCGLPIGTYTGIEVEEKLVRFLIEEVKDKRFNFYHVDVANQYYNPNGLSNIGKPLGDKLFDIACMFSVITHQTPDEARLIFRFLRDHLRDDGHLFFSTIVHEGGQDFFEEDLERPGFRCSYRTDFLKKILGEFGFVVESVVGRNPSGLPIVTSLLCTVAHG